MPKTEVTSDAPAIAADRGYLLTVTDLMSNQPSARPRPPGGSAGAGQRIPGVADYLGEFTRDPHVARRNNLLSSRADEAFIHMT